MRKRIIALLLALILTVGLLPTVALATEGNPTPDSDSTGTAQSSTVQSGTDSANNDDNPVHVIKTFTPGEDGAYGNLTLEAYVTNPLQVVTETTPLDIVLVLDQSGSMGYCINCGTEFNNEKWDNDQCNTTSVSYQYTVVSRANADKNKKYYTPVDGKYYEADWCDGWHWFVVPYKAHEEGWYYYGDYGHTRVTGDLYVRTKITGHKHRLDALTEALNTFVNSVVANGGDHNVAVVGYAGTRYSSNDKRDAHNSELLTGTNLNKGREYSGNESRYYPQKDLTKDPINGKAYTDLNTSSQEYSSALQSMKTTQGVASVRAAINALTANGATRTYAGMDMAKNILAKAKTANSNRQQVVILFTDGDTDSEQSDVYKLAGDMKENGVLIYTVGLFKGANQTYGSTNEEGDDNNLFLNKVSNNSIEYKNQGSKPRTKTDKTYYLPAQDAASLSAVFAQISREVSLLNLTAKTETVLKDTLSGYFTFDVGENENIADKITIQTAEIDGLNADGTLKWKTPIASSLKPTVNGKTISVNGFNYEENAITIHNADGQTPTYSGNKLIVTIPIKPDMNSDVTWQEGEKTYDTNDIDKNKAGLSNYGYKDKTEKNLSTTLPTSPKAPVTGYTVTYSYTTDSQYKGTALPTGGTYINGQKHDVASGLADVTGHRFEGWHTDEDCTASADGEVVINGSNVTLYGRYVKHTTKVNLTDYIQKTLTATSLPNDYKETFKAKITGTPITVEGGLEITTPEFSAAGTQNFTGTAEVELTYGQNYTFKVKEVKPTTGATEGMTYDETEYTLTVKVSNTGVVTTESSNGAGATKVTITNEYKPGSIDFSLTGKFQKTLNSNTADVPAAGKEFTLTITDTSDNTDKSTITGTAAVGTLTAAGTSYTGSANFTFKKDTEAVSALTFTAAGTYIYKVQETNSNVAGMTYDTTEYTLTVVVADEDKDGALEITSAKVTKKGENDADDVVANLVGTPNDTFTITNTFKGAELPLDPTTDPTTGEVTPKIVKELRVTGNGETAVDMTFNVSVKDKDGKEVATGSAEIKKGAKDKATANFTDLGTLVFPEAGDYTYTIKETKGNTNGVTYDEKTYTLKVEVKEVNNVLTVTSASFSYNNGTAEVSGNFLTDPITITNTYTEPTATVTKTTITKEAWDELPSDVKTVLTNTYGYPQFPVKDANNELKLIVDKNVDEVMLAYVVNINGKAGSTVTISDPEADFWDDEETNGVWLSSADDVDQSKATVDPANGEWTVGFKTDCTVKIFFTKTFNRNKTTDKFDTAVNTVIVNGNSTNSDSTTITDKDPGSFDFSAIIQKELKLTGSKSFTGAEFEATLKLTGIQHEDEDEDEVEINSLTAEYAHVEAWPLNWNYTLVAKFDENAVDGSTTLFLTSNGEHLLLDFPAAGTYTFELQETNKTSTNVTYDDTVYTIEVVVTTDKENSNKLVVTDIEATYVNKDGNDAIAIYVRKEATGHVMTFVNTVDTGKDDYYPIIIPTIIPTIINKDTGMLNKTDHFAYVIGYPDGTVHPNGQITRAEVATIFFRLLRDEVRDGAFTTSNSYSDVAYGKWYNNPISTMSALGIITGYPDGTFKPNKPITRAEFAAIAARFDETQSGKSATFSDVIGHWAAKEIGIAYYNDWIKGYPDGTFKPDQNITRAEAMTLINRVLERKPESPADLLTNMNKWTDNLDTSKWYYLDVQEATNSHGYTRKTFNYELWRQMLPDPDWSRYER